MTRNITTMIIAVWLTSFSQADTTVVQYSGATQEENRQLSGLAAADKLGKMASLKYLDHVINEYPANAPARLYRASALMQMGRMDEASRDLNELTRRSPECLNLSETWIFYYRIKGDRIKELNEMENLAGKTFVNNTTKAFAEVSICSNRPRMAELASNMDLAKKEWQEWVDKAPPQQRADRMTHQVQFFLRQGDYEDAVAVAKAAVELHHRQRHEGYSLANTLTWYGFSLWVSGKRTEALATFLDAAEQPIENIYFNSCTFDPSGRSLAILSARVLAASGTEKDKARAKELMANLSKSVTGKMPYSLEPVVLALSGGSEMKPVVDTVGKVLNQAPNLDWALWAALYLGLSSPPEAKPLSVLLPKDCIQKRIAEQERK